MLTRATNDNNNFNEELNERNILIHSLKLVNKRSPNEVLTMFPNIHDYEKREYIESVLMESRLFEYWKEHAGSYYYLFRLYPSTIKAIGETSIEAVAQKATSPNFEDTFYKVLQYLSENSKDFISVVDVLKILSISDENDELAEAIDRRLYQKNLVFATTNGVMINEDGKSALDEHKFGFKKQSQMNVHIGDKVHTKIEDSFKDIKGNLSYSSESSVTDLNQRVATTPEPKESAHNNPKKKHKALKYVIYTIVATVFATVIVWLIKYLMHHIHWY